MQIAIVNKSQLSEKFQCISALQYTKNCHECDYVFSCKVKSQFHINGIKKKERMETTRVLKARESDLNRIKNNALNALKKLNP